jgi:phosphatidylglycerol:prolipoprotein diacylglycerol transferase
LYPTLYHFFYDAFGFDWPWAKLLNSFGFFVALAFVAASMLLSKELKRKESQGLLQGEKRKVIYGLPVNWADVLTNALIGFILGWKFIYLMSNAGKLFGPDSLPQQHIFSLEGDLLWGLALAALMGGWRYFEMRKQQLPEPVEKEVHVHVFENTGTITFVAAFFGIVGAKLFHLFENPRQFMEFFKHPDLESFLSGLTVYGGLIVAGIAVAIYARRKKIPFLHLADATAPGLILAYGIGRIGCHVSGDGDWGIVNTAEKPGWLSWLPDWAWSYDYPNNVGAISGFDGNTYGMPITDGPCFEGYCTHLVPSVYPTPIYETAMAVLIFGLLWYLRKKWTIPGMIFAMYMIMNGVERFFIEKIRVNNKIDFIGMQVTQAEIISVLFVVCGAGLMFYLRKRWLNHSLPNQKTDDTANA